MPMNEQTTMSQYPLPPTGHITSVHRELVKSVYLFHQQMNVAEEAVPKEVDLEPRTASPELLALFDRKQISQIYSRAVQVFAALAIEAFLHEYGTLRFGSEKAEKDFRWGSPAKRLSNMLRCFLGSFDGGSEIVQVVQRLASGRNALVHPQPEHESWNDDGTRHDASTQRLPPVDPRTAERALRDMELFFELFRSYDPEAAFRIGCPGTA